MRGRGVCRQRRGDWHPVAATSTEKTLKSQLMAPGGKRAWCPSRWTGSMQCQKEEGEDVAGMWWLALPGPGPSRAAGRLQSCDFPFLRICLSSSKSLSALAVFLLGCDRTCLPEQARKWFPVMAGRCWPLGRKAQRASDGKVQVRVQVEVQVQVPAAARSPWADPTAASRCETRTRPGCARLYCALLALTNWTAQPQMQSLATKKWIVERPCKMAMKKANNAYQSDRKDHKTI